MGEYLGYRAVWDLLVKEINSLCRVKDMDEVVVERWWERVVYRHTVVSGNLTVGNSTSHNASTYTTTHNKKPKRTNKQIY